eukprot:TRINITY_DN16906_c0_g1_i2.p1 TRINITY_DN16906_c0_g1~~TRINITY_DN16906_c0_g1_i2.p1  ORF type:complete len:670 (+),score=142.88 TRINITY_DN16906_c0_g1_i2:360-2369(+)
MRKRAAQRADAAAAPPPAAAQRSEAPAPEPIDFPYDILKGLMGSNITPSFFPENQKADFWSMEGSRPASTLTAVSLARHPLGKPDAVCVQSDHRREYHFTFSETVPAGPQPDTAALPPVSRLNYDYFKNASLPVPVRRLSLDEGLTCRRCIEVEDGGKSHKGHTYGPGCRGVALGKKKDRASPAPRPPSPPPSPPPPKDRKSVDQAAPAVPFPAMSSSDFRTLPTEDLRAYAERYGCTGKDKKTLLKELNPLRKWVQKEGDLVAMAPVTLENLKIVEVRVLCDKHGISMEGKLKPALQMELRKVRAELEVQQVDTRHIDLRSLPLHELKVVTIKALCLKHGLPTTGTVRDMRRALSGVKESLLAADAASLSDSSSEEVGVAAAPRARGDAADMPIEVDADLAAPIGLTSISTEAFKALALTELQDLADKYGLERSLGREKRPLQIALVGLRTWLREFQKKGGLAALPGRALHDLEAPRVRVLCEKHGIPTVGKIKRALVVELRKVKTALLAQQPAIDVDSESAAGISGVGLDETSAAGEPAAQPQPCEEADESMGDVLTFLSSLAAEPVGGSFASMSAEDFFALSTIELHELADYYGVASGCGRARQEELNALRVWLHEEGDLAALTSTQLDSLNMKEVKALCDKYDVPVSDRADRHALLDRLKQKARQ